MRIIIILLLAGLFTACGAENKPAPVSDARAVDIVIGLEDELETDLPFHSIEIKPLPGGRAGTCMTDGRILIDSQFYDTADALPLKSLVLHEIGHCSFNLPHIAEEDPEGCGTSLMHPVNQTQCIKRHWDDYKNDFLTRIKGK